MINYSKKINYSLKRFSFLILIIFIMFSILQIIQIYNDYLNFKNKNKMICRYNNIIEAKEKICYGNVNGDFNNTEYFWTGNHVWSVNNNNREDLTCPDCEIVETIGCLKIKNGYVQPKFNTLENSIASYYFLEFNMLKYLDLINK